MFARNPTLPIIALLVALTSIACSSERGEEVAEEAQPAAQATETQSERAPLPQYTVLETVDQMTGGRWGAVLVRTLTRDTTAARRAEIAREIATRESLAEVTLYCSEHAWRADASASYAARYPNALRDCALGTLKGRQFTSYDELVQ